MKILKIFKNAYPEHYEVYKAAVVDIFGQETLRTLVLRYEGGEKMTKIMSSNTQRDYMYQKHISAMAMLKNYIPVEVDNLADGISFDAMIGMLHAYKCKFDEKWKDKIDNAQKRRDEYAIKRDARRAEECKDAAYIFIQTYRMAISGGDITN